MVSDSTTDAFEVFFQNQYSALVRWLARPGTALESCEDAAQSAMLQLYQQWGQVINPHAWVRTVAYRALLQDSVRHTRTTRRAIEGGWVPTTEPPPADTIDAADWAADLLNRLPPTQRAMLALRIVGMAPSDIAHHLGVKPATVRQNLHRARARLQPLVTAEACG